WECGNGVVEPQETCDDGNRVSNDGCDGVTCLLEVCGDGIVQRPREHCEDGNDDDTDDCVDCRYPPPALELVGDQAFGGLGRVVEIDGDHAAIAEPGLDVVHVLHRDGETWAPIATLT